MDIFSETNEGEDESIDIFAESTPDIPHVPQRAQAATKAALQAIDPEVMLDNYQRKSRMEEKAWQALDYLLEEQTVVCPKCNGNAATRKGEPCRTCQGEGTLIKPPDPQMVKLVLEPKFPKTTLNINAEVEKMNAQDLMSAIERM